MDDPATKHLDPLAIEVNFKLERGLREREIGIDPSHFAGSKQSFGKVLNFALQISNSLINSDRVFASKHSDGLHLMKDRIMIPINFIPPVYIPKYKEIVEP